MFGHTWVKRTSEYSISISGVISWPYYCFKFWFPISSGDPLFINILLYLSQDLFDRLYNRQNLIINSSRVNEFTKWLGDQLFSKLDYQIWFKNSDLWYSKTIMKLQIHIQSTMRNSLWAFRPSLWSYQSIHWN